MVKFMVPPRCTNCGARFFPGNDENGIPNGMTFVLKDKTKITMCKSCLCAFGDMPDEMKDEFIAELKEKKNGNR